MTTTNYHSVYLEPAGAKPRQRWSDSGSVAFVHDICSGPLPDTYQDCDVLYGDLPWQQGFSGYNDRAGVTDGRTYRTFLEAVAGIVTSQPQPVVLITGRHALRYLPDPDQQLAITVPVLNQAALALTYRIQLPTRLRITTEILAELAREFDRVGDFCCGYGRSSRAFARAGKTFVASDYNPECIGYIADHAPGWVTRG